MFVNELGKVGYNIVLSNDLRNNQGTIFELGEKAVKGTDWIIDKENSDIKENSSRFQKSLRNNINYPLLALYKDAI